MENNKNFFSWRRRDVDEQETGPLILDSFVFVDEIRVKCSWWVIDQSSHIKMQDIFPHLVCQMQQILLLMNEERCQTYRDELIKLLTKGQRCGFIIHQVQNSVLSLTKCRDTEVYYLYTIFHLKVSFVK